MSQDQEKRKRGGARHRLPIYSSPGLILDSSVAAVLFTEGAAESPRLPGRIAAAALALMVVRRHGAAPCLARYHLDVRLDSDGGVRVGPETLDAAYNLDIGYHNRDRPGYLSTQQHRLEGRVAAKMGGLLELAASEPSRLRPQSAATPPAVSFGYEDPLPMRRSPALERLARKIFELAPAVAPTRDQLHAAWDALPDLYVGDGGRQFIYPGRFIAFTPTTSPSEHPETGEARPETSESRDGVLHRGWVSRDGEWLPCIPAGATPWLDGAAVSGRDCENPALGVWRTYNFVDRKAPLAAVMADARELGRIRAVLREMPPSARYEMVSQLRRRARNNVALTDQDLFEALLDPSAPLRASEEPNVQLFRLSPGASAVPGWDVDLESLPPRFNHILEYRRGRHAQAMVGGARAPHRSVRA